MAEQQHDRVQAEERLSLLFEPDILLPTQFFAQLKRKRYKCGEHRLLVAIIQDAVECFQKHLHAADSKRRQLYLDSEAWVSAEDDRGPFSFTSVCDLLEMNPDYVREGLFHWRERERGRYRARQLEAAREAVTDSSEELSVTVEMRVEAVAGGR